MANDPNITSATPAPPAGFIPDSQTATASSAPPPPPGFVADSQTQAGSRQSSDSNSQPGAFSRFVSGALDEAQGAVTGAVQTAGQVGKAFSSLQVAAQVPISRETVHLPGQLSRQISLVRDSALIRH